MRALPPVAAKSTPEQPKPPEPKAPRKPRGPSRAQQLKLLEETYSVAFDAMLAAVDGLTEAAAAAETATDPELLERTRLVVMANRMRRRALNDLVDFDLSGDD